MPPLFLGVTIGVLVCLVAISAFSSSESAIFSLTDDWIDEHERTDDPRVATLQALRSDPPPAARDDPRREQRPSRSLVSRPS